MDGYDASMDFTRQSIVEALTALGEALYQRRKVGDIAVFGGSAMILQFDVAFVTDDIDAIISTGHGDVMQAVQEIGRERGWNSSWLNEGVSVYLSPNARDHLTPYGVFPDSERVGLRVYVAKPDYILALKLRALRIGSRDFEDVVTLANHLGLRALDELVAVVARNFPREPLDTRKRLLLADVVAMLA